jgi:hypothetical protein
MVSSNNFWENCPSDARSWIEDNIIFVRVTTPTWLSDTEASSSNEDRIAAVAAAGA